MSETSNTELIAEIRAGNMEDRSWMIDALDRAANALESSTASHTETEADLQASRSRENVSAGFATRDVAYVIEELVKAGVSTESILAGALVGALDLASAAPSPTLEAVKAADVTAGTVVRSAEGTIACRFDQTLGVVFGDDRPFAWSLLADPIEVLWLPVETEGESR